VKRQNELIQQQAKILPLKEREKILTSFKEIEFHGLLKDLLEKIEPENYVEITHGVEEQGNDLVMIRKDPYFGESIIGIIVESGNVSGQTKGKVDEIKSHIDQSLTSHIKLKGVAKPLFISEIWIVIVGKISGRAHDRLNRELKGKNIRIFDIKWLVEKFTDFYPEVFFDERIMSFLQTKISELEKRHLFSKKGKNLTECFVDPLIAMIDIPGKFDEKKSLVTIEKQILSFTQLKDIIAPRAKVILVGDPGVGKSVALAKFVIDRLRELWSFAVQKKKLPDQIKIPVLISAKNFLEFTNSEELVKDYIGRGSPIERFRITVLMIDGLDEVLPHQRNDILLKVEEFSKQLNCAILITTRKIELIKTPPIGFEKYELLPFKFNQALKLFEKLTSNTQILGILKDGLGRIKYQIPMYPLSLLLLIEIAESYKEIPASITELYDRFVDIALGRYDREKGIEIFFEYIIKKRFLSQLAFKEFFEKKRTEIPEKEFNDFLTSYAHLYGWDEEKLKEFIREIERAGILDFKETILFRHRSFLEYFGAFYIYDNQREFENLEDFLTQIYFEDFWGEVTFFYIGLDRRVSLSLLNRIFDFPKKGLKEYIDKFLCGRLLQAGWLSPAIVRHQGIKKVISLAPTIRQEFLKLRDLTEVTFPRIISDIFVMALSEISLVSGILMKEEKKVFEVLLEATKPSYRNIYMMLPLLWSLQKFLNSQENRELIDKTLGALSKISPDPEEEAIVILLILLEQTDKAIMKTLKRKLNKLSRRYPEIFKKLLPPKPKGFRA